jgi:hypothetical protein
MRYASRNSIYNNIDKKYLMACVKMYKGDNTLMEEYENREEEEEKEGVLGRIIGDGSDTKSRRSNKKKFDNPLKNPGKTLSKMNDSKKVNETIMEEEKEDSTVDDEDDFTYNDEYINMKSIGITQ